MKSEKEKMLAGEIYNANYDEALIAERNTCKALCFEYNNTHPNRAEERKAIMQKILGRCSNNFVIEPQFYCDYGYNIEIGNNFFANHNLIILDCAKVTFGDNVFIAPNCAFYTAGHPLNPTERNRGLEYAKPITIGNNVWIGGNVIVLPGVTIGDNTTIGAGSIVTKDIPANVVALGNPCKAIRDI